MLQTNPYHDPCTFTHESAHTGRKADKQGPFVVVIVVLIFVIERKKRTKIMILKVKIFAPIPMKKRFRQICTFSANAYSSVSSNRFFYQLFPPPSAKPMRVHAHTHTHTHIYIYWMTAVFFHSWPRDWLTSLYWSISPLLIVSRELPWWGKFTPSHDLQMKYLVLFHFVPERLTTFSNLLKN